MRFSRVSILVALLCLVASVAGAQDGTITGTAMDDTKAVLPGVSITATDQETGRVATAITDERGEYRLVRIPAGKYTVQAELSGFSSVVLKDVELLVGNNLAIPFTMKLAQVSETLTVIGETPLVDTASSQVAGNVDRRQMEELPLQGRNWMELSKLIKGITANDVTNQPGVGRDDMFQINLDGQQITQKVAGSGFGQPRFSRESIAEFQISSQFDVTQGRSMGIEVQAITRSGTNKATGSVYGFFRDDKFNAADSISNRVLPYQNQQVGGAGGGPIVKDKMHFFGSFEYEREPSTLVTSPAQLQIANAAPVSFQVPFKNTQKSFLGRFDDQIATNDRLTIRGSRWNWDNPFVLGAGGHPSNAYVSTQSATNLVGIWNRVMSGNKIQELRVGYNNFSWTRNPLPGLGSGIEYNFVNLIIGGPYNYPQLFDQNNIEARYDLNWHRGSHDLKIGGEYLHVQHSGTWFIQQRGRLIFNSNPSAAVLNTLFPAAAWNDPSKWNSAGIATSGAVVNRFDQNFHAGDWGIDTPRPTWAMWIGDNWRVGNQLTINFGLRWDVDWGVANPPGVVLTDVPINNNGAAAGTDIPAMLGTDFGYKDNIRDNTNLAPRGGFTYNVGGSNNLVIRGGTGLYYSTPVSNMTFSPQIYSQMVTASFLPPASGTCANGSLFVVSPACGITTFDQAKAFAPPQSPRIISPEYRNPLTWQSGIGFQKQINTVTSFEADLTHFNSYRDTRTIDPNLFYNPATGYNLNPAAVGGVPNRPNKAYTQIAYFVSDGYGDNTQLSMALNRRFRNNFQAGWTYTYMFEMHDNGNIGYTAPGQNNQFDYRDGEYATSTDFQRHTVRLHALYRAPWGLSTAVSYFYGSGARFAASIATAPYGKPGTNRLNLTAAGGAAATIVIPDSRELRDAAGNVIAVIPIASRFHGPASIPSGMVIPRNALQGMPLHKVDLRVTKDFKLTGTTRVSLIAEIYNLFNHANYGSYNTSLSSASFGLPQQNVGNAYVPRQASFAFRVGF